MRLAASGTDRAPRARVGVASLDVAVRMSRRGAAVESGSCCTGRAAGRVNSTCDQPAHSAAGRAVFTSGGAVSDHPGGFILVSDDDDDAGADDEDDESLTVGAAAGTPYSSAPSRRVGFRVFCC